MQYKGVYYNAEDITGLSLEDTKAALEKLFGEQYTDYETAWILEYNSIGRCVAQHYFSVHDKKWHRSYTPVTNYSSWHNAKFPYGDIAKTILSITGHKEKQEIQVRKFFNAQKT